MKRYDLRHLKGEFLGRLEEILSSLASGEVAIFLFEKGEHENIQRSADLVKSKDLILMNSLQFNHIDWTIVVKKP